MTKEEIKQKTSLCFLLNQNVLEEEKNYVIERVMDTKATTVSKASLCNIITYIMKQNAKLKSKNCWKTCEYAEPKSQWISQHIQDVVQITKAKEIIKDLLQCLPKENIEGVYEITEKAEEFLKEVEEKSLEPLR